MKSRGVQLQHLSQVQDYQEMGKAGVVVRSGTTVNKVWGGNEYNSISGKRIRTLRRGRGDRCIVRSRLKVERRGGDGLYVLKG